MPDILCNTSPLLYLHQIRQLDVLPGLYGQIRVPEAVRGELEEGARLGHDVPRVSGLRWISIEAAPHVAALRMVTDLDAGEREVLALALHAPGCVVLLDDGRARRHAAMLGLSCTGTLGVLIRARQKGMIQQLRPCIDHLGQLGFRMSDRLRESALALAGEAPG